MGSDVLSKRLIVTIATFLGLVLVAGAVIAVAVSIDATGHGQVAAVTTTTNTPTTNTPATKTAAPLDLTTVPADIAEHYEYAAAHLVEFRQIPCWCGCMQYLGHRNLADCFIRADGKGWEAHAATCSVCIAEATMAERMLRQGQSAHDVAEAVTLQFGQSSVTTPSVQ